jgi:hypothetical protein
MAHSKVAKKFVHQRVNGRRAYDDLWAWLINYIDIKAKFCHKKITVKGLCGRCLKTGNTVSMLEFSTQLCELLPL